MALPLLSVPDAVAVFASHGVVVTDETVRRWAKDRKLRHVRLPSGRIRFRREDIEAFLTPTDDDLDGAA